MFQNKKPSDICRTFIAMGLTAVLSASVTAQEWPIQNPPVHRAVPQYRPAYPLVPDSVHQNSAQPPSETEIKDFFSENGEPRSEAVGVTNPMPYHAATNRPTPSLPTETVVTSPATDAFSQPPADRQTAPSRPTAKIGNVHEKSFGLDYSHYRDVQPYPVDPRKPCNACTHPSQSCANGRLTGNHGRPYRETEPGGCQCGKKSCPKCNEFSVYWPRPLASKWPASSCQPRALDVFDPLVNFKLINYQRTDNGYCGPGSDPYGCLGESRHAQAMGNANFIR